MVTDPCGTCRGEGRVKERRTLNVKIPPGVDNGSNIRVPRQGDAGRRGASSGHLYLNIKVNPHPVFTRQGSDIHLQVPITVSQAVLGGTVQIPTIDSDVELKIPPGTQPGETRVLRGRGLAQLGARAGEKGNQFVHFSLVVPTRLSTRQRELMEEFGKEELASQSADGSKGVFGRLKDFLRAKQ